MRPPVKKNGIWWRQTDDGRWQWWNPDDVIWEDSVTPPPEDEAAREPSEPNEEPRDPVEEPIEPGAEPDEEPVRPPSEADPVLPSTAEVLATIPPAAPGTEPEYRMSRTPTSFVKALAYVIIVGLVLSSGVYLYDALVSGDGDARERTGPGFAVTEGDLPANAIACATTQALPPVEPAADLEEEVDRMSERVERLRALEFEKDVTIDLARPDEVAERVQELQLENYGVRQRERDEQTLLALGAIPEGTDVEDLLEDLATGILGFYVPEDEELMVGSGADDLTVNARLTLAHELEHALADQVFGLPLKDDVPGPELDASLAARALIEGDATLLTQHYAMTSVTTEEANDLLDDPALQAAIDAGERLPHAIRRASEFPYVQGLAFVCDLYGEGGWDAVDAAYEELPTTTAQIMFPERYRSGEGAIEPEPPGEVQQEGWTLADRSAFGAADLMLLFEAPGNDTDAALPSATTAASGWAGGTLHLWEGAGEVALGIALVEREDGDRLCASMQTWYQRAFPNDDHLAGVGEEKLVSRGTQQDAVLRCSGATVRLGIGPDASIARDLTR